jgi:hypothetical protein
MKFVGNHSTPRHAIDPSVEGWLFYRREELHKTSRQREGGGLFHGNDLHLEAGVGPLVLPSRGVGSVISLRGASDLV